MDKIVKYALNLYKNMQAELTSIRERDPAADSNTEIALLYSGYHAVLAYRIAHILHVRALSQVVKTEVVKDGPV